MSTLTPDRESCFRSLYGDAYADVLRFVQRRSHPAHAEDVVADAFLVAWRRFDDAPKVRDDARAWLFGIARNCLLNARRGQERRDALAVRLAEVVPRVGGVDGHDPDHIAARLDIAVAWRRLSDTDQEVLSLAVFEDLTSPQAARVLGPPRTPTGCGCSAPDGRFTGNSKSRPRWATRPPSSWRHDREHLTRSGHPLARPGD